MGGIGGPSACRPDQRRQQGSQVTEDQPSERGSGREVEEVGGGHGERSGSSRRPLWGTSPKIVNLNLRDIPSLTTTENRFLHVHALKVRAFEVCSFKNCTVDDGSRKVGSAQIGVRKICSRKYCTVEISIPAIRPGQISSCQVRTTKASATPAWNNNIVDAFDWVGSCKISM